MNRRPNILMIMNDQHNAQCFGYRGHPDVKTPVIDRLAAEGVRFDECFCQNGVCVPSRISQLTGMYAHTHGIFGDDEAGIPASLLSLPRHLQAFGYQTALVGKKHIPGWPTHGFQYERLCYHADAPVRNLDYYNYLKRLGLHAAYDDQGDSDKFTLGGKSVPVEHSLEVWTANETIKYLDQRDPERPFFLQTSFERPHPPMTLPIGCPFVYDPDKITLPPNTREIVHQSPIKFFRYCEEKWVKSYHGERVLREALCAYYSLITLIDREIGRILDHLDKLGIRDNTLIVFCADHGEYAGEYSKMAKAWCFDAVHRIPYIWNWRGTIPAGGVKTGLVESIDFFPTVCRLLDVPIPKSVQGRELNDYLFTGADSDREAIYYEYTGVKTVRTKKYKLSYLWDGRREVGELFDLEADPYEYDNLFEKPEAMAAREKMLRLLTNWWIATQQPPNIDIGHTPLPPSRWFECYGSEYEYPH